MAHNKHYLIRTQVLTYGKLHNRNYGRDGGDAVMSTSDSFDDAGSKPIDVHAVKEMTTHTGQMSVFKGMAK